MIFILVLFSAGHLPSPCKALEDVKFRGKLMTDFYQYNYSDGGKSNWRSGMRCDIASEKLFIKGLQFAVDVKYRYYGSQWKDSVKSVYELALSYRPPNDGIYWKGGRFNLYDLSGIGELDGGAVGWSFSKNTLAGYYYGYEPNLLYLDTDLDYQKQGVFFHYRELPNLKTIFSYNQIEFQGLTERAFLYGQAYITFLEKIYSYQHLEYEMGPLQENHLTRLFCNTRFDLTNSVSMTGSYYSGRGYDYHRIILEKIRSGQQPASEDLEPFYWYQNLNFRASFRWRKNQRFSGHTSLACKEKGGDILPRYGVSYSVDGLLEGKVGGFIRLTRTVGINTIRNMLYVDIESQINNWLSCGFNYSNYTFQLKEEDDTIICPPNSHEYGLNFSLRMNRHFFIYGYIQYIMETQNCLQNYLSFVYRL